MDPRLNPFAPGAGTPPPELAGRDDLLERAAVALDRIRAGRSARSFILYGLRGVGKTVLLNRMRQDAESRGIASVRMEVPEERSLPALLIPALRATLLRLSRGEAFRDTLLQGMRALAGFTKALKVKYQDIEFSIDVDPETGLADSSDLDTDLTDLLVTLGKAAGDRSTAIVLFIDELQYVPEDQLAALIAALHSASQEQLPITMVAAGLPQLVGRAGDAKSYAERLFEFTPVDRLRDDDQRRRGWAGLAADRHPRPPQQLPSPGTDPLFRRSFSSADHGLHGSGCSRRPHASLHLRPRAQRLAPHSRRDG